MKTIAAALLLLVLIPASALQREVKDKYRAIDVDKFAIQSGVQFPADHLADLQKEIVKQLSESKEFQQVLPSGGNLNGSDLPVLHLSGTITYFGVGGRVSLGQAGPASGHEMDAQVSFADSSTKQMIQTAEVRASLAGYSSIKDTIREFAKQIAIKTKIVLNTRIEESNAPVTPATTMPTSSSPPAAAEVQVVSISAKDWASSQQRLDDSASAGYRVAGLSRTGKYTADIKLEKTDSPSIYHYRLLHTIVASNLQKDMNQYAADGFRVASHTLSDLGYWTTVIMEKPPTPATATYVYLIDESRRVSAAQKNVEKDQAQGYTMVDQSDHGALHMLLFEKIVQDKKY